LSIYWLLDLTYESLSFTHTHTHTYCKEGYASRNKNKNISTTSYTFNCFSLLVTNSLIFNFYNTMDMHKDYAYQNFNSCFQKITRIQPNLQEQKQHELDIKSRSSKTKQKKHQTSSLESVKIKIQWEKPRSLKNCWYPFFGHEKRESDMRVFGSSWTLNSQNPKWPNMYFELAHLWTNMVTHKDKP